VKNIVWTDIAIDRLNAILDIILLDDVNTADHILDEIHSVTTIIADFPQIGKIIDDQDDHENREMIIRGTYVLIYRDSGDDVIVMSIRHTKQSN